MAGEHIESGEHDKAASNGVTSIADDRAAFLTGNSGKDDSDEEVKPSKDDDADLDDDDDEEVEAVDADESDEDESDDPDKDLEDEDEKPAKVEPEVAKRLEQVRRTDKRLREQRESQFKERESQIDATIKKWEPKLEAAEEFEKLKSRKHDPIAILKAIGYSEDDFADVAREAWAHSPDGAKDPKVKEAIHKTRKEREMADELANIKKSLAEREKTEKEREQQAVREREVEAFIGKVSKAATEKTPLAAKFLAAEPETARIELEVIAGRLAQQLGQMPDPKKVMIEFEKSQRRMLRRYGIDPATVKAATPKPELATTAKKTAAKKPAAPRADDTDDDKPLTKADFVRAARSNALPD